MTLAAVDRLVHHATILEMNVESYRRRTALERKRGPADRRAAQRRKLSNESHQLIVVPRQAAEKSPLPATINAANIDPPRYQIAILIVAGFLSRLSRYRRMTELRKAVVDNCRIGNRN
jgi:hypothetical protein